MENKKTYIDYQRPSRNEVMKMSPNSKKKHQKILQQIAVEKYVKSKGSRHQLQYATVKRYHQTEKGKAMLKRKRDKAKAKKIASLEK